SKKGVAVREYGDEEAGAATDNIAAEHAKNEGLEKILPEHPQRIKEPYGDCAWRWKQHRGHAEAAHRHLPEIEYEGAEQQRDREINRAGSRLVARVYRPHLGHAPPPPAPNRPHRPP